MSSALELGLHPVLQQNGKLRPAKAHHFNHYLGVNNYWARRLRIPQNLEEGLGICVQIQSNPNQILEELFKAFASGCPWKRCEHGWGVIPSLLIMEFCCIFCSWEAGRSRVLLQRGAGVLASEMCHLVGKRPEGEPATASVHL